jgi:hypothetical protein
MLVRTSEPVCFLCPCWVSVPQAISLPLPASRVFGSLIAFNAAAAFAIEPARGGRRACPPRQRQSNRARSNSNVRLVSATGYQDSWTLPCVLLADER